MPKIDEYYVEDKFRNTSLFDRKNHFQLTAEKYWHDINDCWELIENCKEHLEILEECRRFTDWKINEDEKDEIILNWLRNTIKSSEEIEQRFFKKNDKL